MGKENAITASEILAEAKQNGSLKDTIQDHIEHADDYGIKDIEQLFPNATEVNNPPKMINHPIEWVSKVINGVSKSPFSRIRTTFADITDESLRAKGYLKTKKKKEAAITVLKRSTSPTTIYKKQKIDRDDVIDITEYDVVGFKYQEMREDLEEEIATAILIGDGRDDVDEDKISEDHIRSILNDDELYTIHYEIKIDETKKELQGNATGENFGDNYIYAESIIKAALYSREQFKGSGQPVFFCTPHLVNVMILAKDRNGRPIYNSVTELASKLNVSKIVTIEKLEGVKREDDKHTEHKLLGIFVNLNDYQVGCTKGGEITKFENFDIDFNRYKYLIETRLSGALTRIKSAIVLEEPVASNGITHTEG